VSLLEANPYIDRIHSYEDNMRATIRSLRSEGIDYVIDLHSNLRSARIKYGLKRFAFSVRKLNWLKWLYVNFKLNRLPDLHMVDRNLDTIKSFIDGTDDKGLDYFIPETSEVDISKLPKVFGKGYLGLSIGAHHETKKLPTESLVSLCEKLDYPVVILGGPEDRERAELISSALPGKDIFNACGDFSIHQSASLVRQSRVLITHDTGLMHIGAAYKKKIISVWGNTVPDFGMFPYRADSSSLRFEVKGLSCRPCSKIGYQKCPKTHFRCMLDQDLERIAASTEFLWNAP
jgi:ADP-heptose:LPS heptosyltransferase